MAERDFKGIWIPREIWLDDRLNALDKVILAEIDSLDNGDEHCYAGNDYLAEFCQCSTSKVTKTVSKLTELGYIAVHSFDGRVRRLRSSLGCFTVQSSKKYEADEQNIRPISISSNLGNISLSRKGADKEIPAGFDDFWRLYPRKVNKATAIKAWAKLKPSDALQKTINADIQRRVDGEWKDKDEQFIPHASTYLNQRRWEDEHPAMEPKPAPKPEAFDWRNLSPSEQIRLHEQMAHKERVAEGLIDEQGRKL